MIRKISALILLAVLSLPAWADSEQPPYEVGDPATSENFRNIYYGLDDLVRQVADIDVAISSAVAGVPTGLRNRIINGSFEFNQRVTTTTTDDSYLFDRWYALVQTSSVNVTQQTLQENGQRTNIRLTQPSASAQRIGIAQIVESVHIQDLRGQDITLSLRVRSSLSQAIRCTVIEWTGTADSVTSDVVSDWTSSSYAAGAFFIAGPTITGVASVTPQANTWTDLSVSGSLTSSANNVVVMVWTEGTFAQSATLDIGNAQMETGDEATAFDPRSYGHELSLCMRYYQKTYELATAPGSVTYSGNLVTRRAASGETSTFFPSYFPVVMRSAPTITWYNPATGASGGIRNDSGPSNITVTGTDTQDPTTTKKPGSPTHTGNGTASNIIVGHYTADSEL